MQRGILGVKKDPKNPVLYFNSQTEEWPSDDSNDADYKLKEKQVQSHRMVVMAKKVRRASPNPKRKVDWC